MFAEALLRRSSGAATRFVRATYGMKYVFEKPLPTPNGTSPMVRSVWQEHDDQRGAAVLITAVPI
jgi:hypothetical protein